MMGNQIPGANLQKMTQRNEAWCRNYFGSKYHMLAGQYKAYNKFTKASLNDDLINNMYNNCIVGFNMKAMKSKTKCHWRIVYAKFGYYEEIENGCWEPPVVSPL